MLLRSVFVFPLARCAQRSLLVAPATAARSRLDSVSFPHLRPGPSTFQSRNMASHMSDKCPATDPAAVPNPLGEGKYIQCVRVWGGGQGARVQRH